MRIHTFVVGIIFALALLLFAQKRFSEQPRPSGFSAVLDLTHQVDQSPSRPRMQDTSKSLIAKTAATHLEAPSSFARGMWTVSAIPAERLVAPLVVLDVRKQVQSNPDYQISMQDLAGWEKVHGDIPQGAIVMAYTGSHQSSSFSTSRRSTARPMSAFPGSSLDAAEFLTEARQIVGLGIDTSSVDSGASPDSAVRDFTLSHSVYQLENVANLGIVPPSGATAVVAPAKLANSSVAPVRILALVRSSAESRQDRD